MTPATLELRDGRTAIVDAEDLERVGEGWYAHRSHSVEYIVRRRAGVMERLHRIVIGAAPGDIVDHVNRDTFDNRRQNLRLVDHQQSRANSGNHSGRSSFRGVSWSSEKGRWRARLRVRGRSCHLGYFDSEAEAAAAWNAGAVAEWGEFAALNDLPV